MNTREERIERHMRYCQHYDAGGVTMIGGKEPSGHCLAGVNYQMQFPQPDASKPANFGIFKRLCCTQGGVRSEEEQRTLCPQWLRSTREQAEAEEDEFDAEIQRMTIVGPVVAEWRKKPPKGKAEVIECTACKGRLHLSQSAYNGHVHGQCETAGCVSWME